MLVDVPIFPALHFLSGKFLVYQQLRVRKDVEPQIMSEKCLILLLHHEQLRIPLIVWGHPSCVGLMWKL